MNRSGSLWWPRSCWPALGSLSSPSSTSPSWTSRAGPYESWHILTNVRTRANDLLLDRGLPPIGHLTPHTLRRTFASLLAEVGVSPRRAMYLLGHTDPTLTMRVYQQVLDMGATAPDQLAELLGCTVDEAFTLLSGRGFGHRRTLGRENGP